MYDFKWNWLLVRIRLALLLLSRSICGFNKEWQASENLLTTYLWSFSCTSIQQNNYIRYNLLIKGNLNSLGYPFIIPDFGAQKGKSSKLQCLFQLSAHSLFIMWKRTKMLWLFRKLSRVFLIRHFLPNPGRICQHWQRRAK